MRRLIVFTAIMLILIVPTVSKTESLEKIDELQGRFDDYDRRLTSVEKKIQLLLDYFRKGQGSVLNEQREFDRPTDFENRNLSKPPISTTARLRVMEDGANVFERPSSTSKAIARVNAGTWLEVRDRTEQDGWYHVILPGGQIGYVDERILEPMR